MPQITPEELGKFQKLLAKNPLAFVGAVFFVMFCVTYWININKNSDAEQYWKELYQKERDKNDALQLELLIKAGVLDKKERVIEKQNKVIKKADSTLKDNLSETLEKLNK
ncbi:MAG: hypothetical protein ACRC8Z_04985 [Empedobacter falsenii]